MNSHSALVEVYIGAPIDAGSEKSLLPILYELLHRKGTPAVIFANTIVNNRQIDFIVGTDEATFVIEVKGYTLPVSGGMNGDWHCRLPDGTQKSIRNPYIQTLNAAFAAKDFIAPHSRDYAQGVLVFAPSAPPGSADFRGDFKVAVSDFANLATILSRQTKLRRPVTSWRDVASRLDLKRVSNLHSAIDPTLLEDEAVLDLYVKSFRATYLPQVGGLQTQTYSLGDQEIDTPHLVEEVTGRNESLILIGGSGNGKSMVSTFCALNASANGTIPFVVAARDFDGELGALLNEECQLIADCAAARLLRAARRHSRRILLVVDGYNECAPQHQDRLSRAVSAFSRRSAAAALISSQELPRIPDILPKSICSILPPTDDLKYSIAQAAFGGNPLPSLVVSMLPVVSSALDARILGEVGALVNDGVSRQWLYEAYARRRLGADSQSHVRFLRAIAGYLARNLTFSISRRELDRFAELQNIDTRLIDDLLSSKLLRARGARIEFLHEQFFYMFAADAIVTISNSIESLVAAFNAPGNRHLQSMILGAVDNVDFQSALLERVDNSTLIQDCIGGSAGAFAQSWAKDRLFKLPSRIIDEIGNTSYSIDDSGWGSVVIERSATWAPVDIALCQILASPEDSGLEIPLHLADLTDERMTSEWKRLLPEARKRKLPLRSNMFANIYGLTGFNRPLASTVFRSIAQGYPNHFPDNLEAALDAHCARQDLSLGQIFLLVHFLSKPIRNIDRLANFLTTTLQRHLTGLPAHLLLDIFQAAMYCHSATLEQRSLLISELEKRLSDENLLMNSAIFDALQSLGAMASDDEEFRTEASKQIESCLRHSDNPEQGINFSDLAFSIYAAQFDHPMSASYCQAVSRLDDEQRQIFLSMAAMANLEFATFVPPLIIDLIRLGDPRSQNCFARWAKLPNRDSIMPQEDMGSFCAAYIGLARLNSDLPEILYNKTDAADRAILACGHLLYWINREKIQGSVRAERVEDIFNELKGFSLPAAVNALRAVETSHLRDMGGLDTNSTAEVSILSVCANQVSSVCRMALPHLESQIGYFKHYGTHTQIEDARFAISILKEYGTVLDTILLRRIHHVPALSSDAISAIGAIENRAP